MRRLLPFLLLLFACAAWHELRQPHATPAQARLVAGARSCLGDVYDSARYPGGPPPKGRGACTDVVYYACLPYVDLQKAVHADRQGQKRDRDLDYRWCPSLMPWFERHARAVTDWQPGDILFWSDGSGVPTHTGVVSDRRAGDGRLMIIHNPGPRCVEEASYYGGTVGHFRLE